MFETSAGAVVGGIVCVRTNSSRLDHVADGKSLDGLVLGRAAGAVAAADRVHMTTTLLVTTVVRSLFEELKLASASERGRWR